MTIPHWLRAYLKPDDVQQIIEAIGTAEATTSGELVPMIVRRSSTIGHVPVILITLLVALFFILDGPARQAELLGGHWIWFVVDIALFIGVTAAGARLHWVQRLLTTRADQADQVESRAVIEFYQSNIHRTRDATGVLIFVSIMERWAVVLADKGINDLVPPDTWSNVCEQLISGIKTKNLGHALREAILSCGEIMTPQFPIQPDDQDELKNQLIIKP